MGQYKTIIGRVEHQNQNAKEKETKSNESKYIEYICH